jgi:hypothetical protein
MLNKIKGRILHELRKYCGYYVLNDALAFASIDYTELYNKYDKISSKHESKILEYDILKSQYYSLKTDYINFLYEVFKG